MTVGTGTTADHGPKSMIGAGAGPIAPWQWAGCPVVVVVSSGAA